MTSRERLLAAIGHRPVDRIPVTLYELHDLGGCWAADEPSYRPLLELQARLGDTFVSCPCGSGLLGDPNAISTSSERGAAAGGESEVVVRTPRGELRSVSRRDPGTVTSWVVKHFVENAEDARRFLSLDLHYEPPELAGLRDLERRLGDSGLLLFGTGDPLGNVVGLWDFSEFVITCYDDLGLVEAMVDRASAYLAKAIDFINRHFRGVCVRFWGPEYCGAPLMDPGRFFRRLVVERVAPLVRKVHEGGNIAIVHCHGHLDALLEMIAETGADVLEPLELLPVTTADVTMTDLRRRVGERMCLAGGMQAVHLDTGNPAFVAEWVRRIVAESGAEGLILLPTSTPLAIPLGESVVASYRALFETAAEIKP